MLGSRKREIRIQADSFREKCKISRYGIIDLFKECDRMGYKLIRYPLGENADLGFALKIDDDIIIFINSSIRLSREIFTLVMILVTPGQHSCNTRTRFLSYPDRILELFGQDS